MVTNIHEAKTNFSKLVERAEAGEEIVIGRAGRPVARLVPFADGPRFREPGTLRGRVVIGPGFDEVDEAIADAFEGSTGPS